MTPIAFRCLTLASPLLLGASALVEVWWPDLTPPALAQALEAMPVPTFGQHEWLPVSLLVWGLLTLLATAGMLFFWRWARALALWSTLAGFAFYPLIGPGVVSGWSSALEEAAAVGWGAALATAYAGAIGDRFAGPRAPAHPPAVEGPA